MGSSKLMYFSFNLNDTWCHPLFAETWECNMYKTNSTDPTKCFIYLFSFIRWFWGKSQPIESISLIWDARHYSQTSYLMIDFWTKSASQLHDNFSFLSLLLLQDIISIENSRQKHISICYCSMGGYWLVHTYSYISLTVFQLAVSYFAFLFVL